MKVLIVEDNPTIVDLLAVVFEVHWPGAYLLCTGSGTSALELFSQENLDLVILDLGLPDMDGLDICRRIRAHSLVPIVIVSARTSAEDIMRGLHMGADDYITKPFKVTDVLTRVRATLAPTSRTSH